MSDRATKVLQIILKVNTSHVSGTINSSSGHPFNFLNTISHRFLNWYSLITFCKLF